MSHVLEKVNSDSVANGQLSAEVDTQEPSASHAWGGGDVKQEEKLNSVYGSGENRGDGERG